MSKKVLLSGIQPSDNTGGNGVYVGTHIGNYFGMMKQMVDMQEDFKVYLMIADYHSLHSIRNPKLMRENIIAMLLDFLAVGIDPKKTTLFLQSEISEHTELCWIFDTVITMPFLMRAHAYKDAEAKNKDIDVGSFNYPVLMAADILLYDAEIVPVGADQKQHIEMARDIAGFFNRVYYDGTFKLPKEMILQDVAIVPGTDGRKMSKSYGNTIPLFAEYEEIKKCVMSIVTDSSGELPQNVYAIHKLVRPESELKQIYAEKAGKYKEIKEVLIEDLEKFIAPLRERRKEFAQDLPSALSILKEGSEKAKKAASIKMDEVREKVGVKVY